MAKFQCRNFPDDLYKLLCEGAESNERSIEGHVRFLLAQTLMNVKPKEPELPDWMVLALKDSARKGFRSVEFEMMKRLAESLADDGYYPPKEECNEKVTPLRVLR